MLEGSKINEEIKMDEEYLKFYNEYKEKEEYMKIDREDCPKCGNRWSKSKFGMKTWYDCLTCGDKAENIIKAHKEEIIGPYTPQYDYMRGLTSLQDMFNTPVPQNISLCDLIKRENSSTGMQEDIKTQVKSIEKSMTEMVESVLFVSPDRYKQICENSEKDVSLSPDEVYKLFRKDKNLLYKVCNMISEEGSCDISIVDGEIEIE